MRLGRKGATPKEDDDPMTRLERAGIKQANLDKAAAMISKARGAIVMDRTPQGAFFARITLQLQPLVDFDQPTGWTDGRFLAYNPDWVVTLSESKVRGFIVHEGSHNLSKHPSRMQSWMDPTKANLAMDLAINSLLRDAGYELPDGGQFPELYGLPQGQSFEEYYRLLPDKGGDKGGGGGGPDPDSEGDGQGKGKPDPDGEGAGDGQDKPNPDPGGCGGVRKPGDGSPAACEEVSNQWDQVISQAETAARKRGSLPGGLERLVGAILRPKPDVANLLREFLTTKAKVEMKWDRPNRRFVHQGIYLPSMSGESLGKGIFSIDTSGSVGEKQMNTMAELIEGVIEQYEVELTILYSDSRIAHVQTWKPDDGPLVLEPKGGGGTSHIPVFDWIAEQDEPPDWVVLLTDCESSFPDTPPDYPYLWCVVGGGSGKPPWGPSVEVPS